MKKCPVMDELMTTFNNRMTGEQSSFVPATETVEEWKARYLNQLAEKAKADEEKWESEYQEELKKIVVTKESVINALCNQYFSLCHDEWDTDEWDKKVEEERKELETLTLEQLIEHEVQLEKNSDYGPTTIEEFIALWE